MIAAAVLNIVDRETLVGWIVYCIVFCCRAVQSGFVLCTVCMYSIVVVIVAVAASG